MASTERPEKILVAMFQLSEGSTRSLKYEDIVVQAFKKFPKDFSLRGYPEYPDSSDIHKPLYGPLKRRGLVRSADKSFALTASGVELAARLVSAPKKDAASGQAAAERLSRDARAEVDRMVAGPAFAFFAAGNAAKILDTDFYAFLGCTVRTPRNEFLGRLERTEAAVAEAARLGYPSPEAGKKLREVLLFLRDTFADLIERNKKGNR